MADKIYIKAYADYKNKVSYADIAKKYKVTLATVKSWYTRHWKSMQEEEELHTKPEEVCSNESVGMQGGRQKEGEKVDADKLRSIVPAVVQKQIAETSPDSLLACDEDYWSKLNDRQRRFVKEYLIDRIGSSAAIRSGYPPKNAAWMSSRLLSDPNIAACIAKAEAERDRRTGLNVELVDIELARILRVNPMDVVDVDTGKIKETATDDDLAAIQSVKVKPVIDKFGNVYYEREVRFVPKDRVLEMAMKRHNMLIERKQIDVTTKVEEMDDEARKKRIRELQSKLAIDIDCEHL